MAKKYKVALQCGHTIPQHTVPAPSNASALTDANMPPYIVVNRWHRTA